MATNATKRTHTPLQGIQQTNTATNRKTHRQTDNEMYRQTKGLLDMQTIQIHHTSQPIACMAGLGDIHTTPKWYATRTNKQPTIRTTDRPSSSSLFTIIC